jgi:hypothetical protein
VSKRGFKLIIEWICRIGLSFLFFLLLWCYWEHYCLQSSCIWYERPDSADVIARVKVRNERWKCCLFIMNIINQITSTLIWYFLPSKVTNKLERLWKVSRLRKILLWIFGPAPYWIRMQIFWWYLTYPLVILIYRFLGWDPKEMVAQGFAEEMSSDWFSMIVSLQSLVFITAPIWSWYIDKWKNRKK